MKREKLIRHIFAAALAAGLIFQQAVVVQAAPGDPDLSFGFLGLKVDHVPYRYMYPAAIAQQADGKLLVAGKMTGGRYPFDRLLLRRYNVNGSVDTGFGLSGFAVYTASFGEDEYIYGEANSVAVQSDGKIVVAGGYYSFGSNEIKPAVYRFTSSGYADTSFGTPDPVFGYQGRATFGVEFQAYGIADSRGGLLTTIQVSGFHRLVRLDSQGALDTGFGVSGMADIGIGYRTFAVNRKGGKIIVGGTVPELEQTVDTEAALQHFNQNGTPDTSHGSNGIAILDLSELNCPFNQYKFISSLDTQSDGKILAGGISGNYNSVFSSFFIRVRSDDSLDPSFSGDGFAVECEGNFLPIVRASRTTTQVLFFTNFFSPNYLRRYSVGGRPQLSFPVNYSVEDFLIQSSDEKPITVQSYAGDIRLRRFIP
ncbi:MAG: hypothetical protein WBD22_09125 [Pyrinomonadaceae bacterium]